MMERIDCAILAAKEAGSIILNSIDSIEVREVEAKQSFDFVTDVDRKCEQTIIDILQNYYPQYSIMAEESGAHQKSGSVRWIIDPLDGTTNYIHGYPNSSISIALEEEGEITVGVIYDPFRDELFRAEKNGGAYLNNKRISVSQENEMSRCLIATGFPFKDKAILEKYWTVFSQIFHKVSDIRRAGSAALDLAYVACGRLDGFWELILSAWDMAAGDIIIREAGGKISDVGGDSLHLEKGNVIATNGVIHKELAAIISPVFA
ncbi:inositol monophosphatase [candidate division KSB1 bacterium]|nr:inositol monophosphatase [candidate division KSB1 bacterium]